MQANFARCDEVFLWPRLIYQCDGDIRKDLYSNVVLSDGTTIFQGTFGCTTNDVIFTVGAKRFSCEEVLLQPSLVYQRNGDIREDLCANVLLSGGRPLIQHPVCLPTALEEI